MITVAEVRTLALSLERTHEAFVHGRIKFRVGQIVYVAFSRDESVMCFAFPREERDALIDTEPEKFLYPRQSDMRFNWVCARCDQLAVPEMQELVVDAWRMVVPKKLATAYDGPGA